MRFPDITIQTQDLLLRRLRWEDLPVYFSRLWSSRELSRYMLWNPHSALEESAASLEKALNRYETGQACRMGIVLKQTEELIGIVDLLRFDEETKSCSFAYMIAENFWGKGYATQALKAALGFAFDQLGMESVSADHFTENPASGAVMRKAGMFWQRHLPGQYEKDGRKYDAEEYRITKKQWNIQKGSG